MQNGGGEEKDTTKLQRLGNSSGLALRKELLLRAGLQRGDRVRVIAAPGELRVLAVDSPLARSLRLGEALCARHARVLRALLCQPPATAPGRRRPSDGQQAWSGQAAASGASQGSDPGSASGAASGSASGPAPAFERSRSRLLLPPAEALISLQSGALADLAQAAGRESPAPLARGQVEAALSACAPETSTPETDALTPSRLAADLMGRLATSASALQQGGAAALAFLAGHLALELNGQYLDVTEGAAMEAMGRLAAANRRDDSDGRAALARWIADNSYPLHRWFT